MDEPDPGGLLPLAHAVDPRYPWLWWAGTGRTRLAGMPAPPAGFSFSFLRDRGLDTIVSLAGPPSYDPRPLVARHFTLEDLASGSPPADPAAQKAEVRRAVVAVRALLADGHGVAVHCGAGIGRTGLVIGAVLVSHGQDPAAVIDWLASVQRARGAPGWPESPWQAEVLAAFA